MRNVKTIIKSTYLLTTLLICIGFTANAQTTRVLIVGDSWAAQQSGDGVHDIVFAANGFGDITVDGQTTVISGSTAAGWVNPSQLSLIATALTAQPDIDTVQLTIGGNDFLDAWNADMTAAEEMLLQQQISDDIQTIIDFILAQDERIQVILSFYDYPNFVDTLTGLSAIFCLPLFNAMAQPTPMEINSAAMRFEATYAELATNNPRVFHVSHFGMMQFTYGFPDVGIQPGDILPPGDLTRPSPTQAMRVTAGILDCFHLRPEGYDILIENLFDNYFRDRFNDNDEVLFSSGFESNLR